MTEICQSLCHSSLHTTIIKKPITQYLIQVCQKEFKILNALGIREHARYWFSLLIEVAKLKVYESRW